MFIVHHLKVQHSIQDLPKIYPANLYLLLFLTHKSSFFYIFFSLFSDYFIRSFEKCSPLLLPYLECFLFYSNSKNTASCTTTDITVSMKTTLRVPLTSFASIVSTDYNLSNFYLDKCISLLYPLTFKLCKNIYIIYFFLSTMTTQNSTFCTIGSQKYVANWIEILFHITII